MALRFSSSQRCSASLSSLELSSELSSKRFFLWNMQHFLDFFLPMFSLSTVSSDHLIFFFGFFRGTSISVTVSAGSTPKTRRQQQQATKHDSKRRGREQVSARETRFLKNNERG